MVQAELLAGHYQPRPARQVYIPNGNGKRRLLGNPTLQDRIVQRAMLMAMKPISGKPIFAVSPMAFGGSAVCISPSAVRFQLQDGTDTVGRGDRR